MKNVHFSSQRLDWKTPKAVYQVLDAEFRFDYDPCPTDPKVDGLESDWGGLTTATRPMDVNFLSGLKGVLKSGEKAKPWCFSYQAGPILRGGTTTA